MYLFCVVQQVLLIYALTFSPVFLAFFNLPALSGVAQKYFMSIVSVALWPLGWALASVLTQAIMDMAANNAVYQDLDGQVVLSTAQSMYYMLILTIWIVTSTIAAPFMVSNILIQGATAGSGLLSRVGFALGQSASYAAGAGITTSMAGGSLPASMLGGAVAGGVGLASGSLGSSNMLVPTGLGILAAKTGGSGNPASYTQRAQEIYKKDSE